MTERYHLFSGKVKTFSDSEWFLVVLEYLQYRWREGISCPTSCSEIRSHVSLKGRYITYGRLSNILEKLAAEGILSYSGEWDRHRVIVIKQEQMDLLPYKLKLLFPGEHEVKVATELMNLFELRWSTGRDLITSSVFLVDLLDSMNVQTTKMEIWSIMWRFRDGGVLQLFQLSDRERILVKKVTPKWVTKKETVVVSEWTGSRLSSSVARLVAAGEHEILLVLPDGKQVVYLRKELEEQGYRFLLSGVK